MDVKAAFHRAAAKLASLTIAEFSTWPLLNEFMACPNGSMGAEKPTKPDGFIRIHERAGTGDEKFEHAFFLEVDRSNEIQDKLVGKAECYLDFYKTGGFAVRCGGTREQFKDFPFRVLMVFKTDERRNNTAERLLQNTPPILTQVWLATMEDVSADPFGAIWVRPIDYRDATKGTPFDAERAPRTFAYRRNGERETFVAANVPKRRLLET